MKEIVGQIKQYHWGKQNNKDNFIVQLLDSSGYINHLQLDRTLPIAEYWLGTHKAGSFEYIDKSDSKPINNLRFLFKVLCVQQSLSLQIHPDKINAEILHKQDPLNYPDPNPKPELVIALGKFRALCGFKCLNEIANLIQSTKTLKEMLNGQIPTNEIELKCVFEFILQKTPNEVELIRLIEELPQEESNLIKELNETYPHDCGLIAAIFLKLHYLDEGDSLFVPANVPHAYLPPGDAIEVMICSDNVIRAALTPKFRDTKNLMKLISLDERIEKNSNLKVLNSTMSLYSAIDHFDVIRVSITSHDQIPCILKASNNYSILLVTKGSCICQDEKKLSKGMSVLLEPGEQIVINQLIDLPFQCFKAF